MRFLGAGGKMGFGVGKITFAEGGDRVETISIGENNYILHFFETVGESSFNVLKDISVDVLIVAGGGGGGGNSINGRGAGGGGAGGVLHLTNIGITAQNYTVIVGNGGEEGVRRSDFSSYTAVQTSGKKGGNSQFWTYVAEGGGGGAGFAASVGYTGGSGGGNRAQVYSPLASGVSGQGTTGGKGVNAGQIDPGGGGGGASGPGLWQDYKLLTGQTTDIVSGGSGKLIDITGVTLAYGGGGGFSTASTWTGLGGTGGGGDGGRLPATTPTSYDPDRVDGKPGLTNTGGGGGAGCGNTTYYGSATFLGNGKGGGGGSGLVIIRYQI